MHFERPVTFYTGSGCSTDFRAPTKSRWAEHSILAHILHPQVRPVYSHNPQCVTKRTTESRKKKNSQVFSKFQLWNRKKQVTVWSASDCLGPVTTRGVIASLDLTHEVNSLWWVVGLSFRLSEAIPKSSFLSELRNHPSEPGESG